MKLKIIFEITVPDGATHFYGDILNDPTFLKKKIIADIEHWFYFSKIKNDWILEKHGNMPFHAKKLEAIINDSWRS